MYHHISPESGNETRFINHNQSTFSFDVANHDKFILEYSNQPLMETPKLRQSVNARIEQAWTDHPSMPDLSPQSYSKFCADGAVIQGQSPSTTLVWRLLGDDIGFRPTSIRKSETYIQVDTVSIFLQRRYDMKVADVSGFVGISAPIFLGKLSWRDYSSATTWPHLPAWFTNLRRQRFTLQSIRIESDWLSASWQLFFGFGRTSQ